jgi:adenylate kinase
MQLPKKEGICDNDGARLLRRPDDEEEVVKNRLNVYKKQTEPIVDFYRKESILAAIKDNGGGPDRITESLLAEIAKINKA